MSELDLLRKRIDALFDADSTRMSRLGKSISGLERRMHELENRHIDSKVNRDAFEWLNRISLLLYGEARPGAIILKRIEDLVREVTESRVS